VPKAITSSIALLVLPLSSRCTRETVKALRGFVGSALTATTIICMLQSSVRVLGVHARFRSWYAAQGVLVEPWSIGVVGEICLDILLYTLVVRLPALVVATCMTLRLLRIRLDLSRCFASMCVTALRLAWPVLLLELLLLPVSIWSLILVHTTSSVLASSLTVLQAFGRSAVRAGRERCPRCLYPRHSLTTCRCPECGYDLREKPDDASKVDTARGDGRWWFDFTVASRDRRRLALLARVETGLTMLAVLAFALVVGWMTLSRVSAPAASKSGLAKVMVGIGPVISINVPESWMFVKADGSAGTISCSRDKVIYLASCSAEAAWELLAPKFNPTCSDEMLVNGVRWLVAPNGPGGVQVISDTDPTVFLAASSTDPDQPWTQDEVVRILRLMSLSTSVKNGGQLGFEGSTDY
jgi:hypothetical protein